MATSNRIASLTIPCLALLAACIALAACGNDSATPHTPAASAVSSLEIADLKPGEGAAIAAGDQAVVQYTGWLYEASAPEKKGKEFDSSTHNGGQPFRFKVGAGEVIKGWDQGVVGMKIGGRRRLTIPADLAYGDSGAGGVIPPGATLVFDVELMGIEAAGSQ
jgi:FKBP-type peptidyl-prolyl cis-trans isomerase FkpA